MNAWNNSIPGKAERLQRRRPRLPSGQRGLIPQPAAGARSAFTLIEVLVAVGLLAAAMAIALGSYASISRAWRRGIVMADSLNHGDYAMEQLVGGLRCAFYPPPQSNAAGGWPDFGFWLEKRGSGAEARDVISWVKSGSALLGSESTLVRGLHRVRVSVEEDSDGVPALAVPARLSRLVIRYRWRAR